MATGTEKGCRQSAPLHCIKSPQHLLGKLLQLKHAYYIQETIAPAAVQRTMRRVRVRNPSSPKVTIPTLPAKRSTVPRLHGSAPGMSNLHVQPPNRKAPRSMTAAALHTSRRCGVVAFGSVAIHHLSIASLRLFRAH